MRPVLPAAPDKGPMGYLTTGPYRIVRWGSDGVSCFVARGAMRGRPWLRFARKIERPNEFYVTGHPTLCEAVTA